jgi:ABC-2 type transport system ATP-binding protein
VDFPLCEGLTVAALELEGVGKRYGDFHAVRDLSFSVEPGSIFGFLGPNGAGKTSTLRMVLGLIPPSSGRITVLGSPQVGARLDRIGFLPEERGLYRLMTPLDAVVYFAGLKGVGAGVARKRGRAMLEAQGLGEAIGRPMKALSKGMAQKVQLICALAHETELVILDEVADARAAAPTRLVLEGALDLPSVAALPGVSSVERQDGAVGGVHLYTLDLAPEASAQAVLRAALQRDLDISQFRMETPTLHDAFIVLTKAHDRPDADRHEAF